MRPWLFQSLRAQIQFRSNLFESAIFRQVAESQLAQELIPLRFQRLRPFDVVCVMPERTPPWAEILQQLPQLRMITSTGA
jgi:hypothetical protein